MLLHASRLRKVSDRSLRTPAGWFADTHRRASTTLYEVAAAMVKIYMELFGVYLASCLQQRSVLLGWHFQCCVDGSVFQQAEPDNRLNGGFTYLIRACCGHCVSTRGSLMSLL